MNKYGKLICLFILFSSMLVCLAGCGEEDNEIVYGNEIGTVSGNVSIDGDEIVVSITNIKAYVGQDIDYLSMVSIPNDSKYDDLEVWVDASAVDIYTPGDYKATYTFKLDSKEKVMDIVVTIIDNDSLGESQTVNGGEAGNQGQTNDFNQNQNSQSEPSSDMLQSTGNGDNYEGNIGYTISNQQTTANNYTTGNQQTSLNNETTGSIETTGGNQTTGSNQMTGSNQTTENSQTTTRREMITSKGTATTANKEIGYSSIELLSGKVVQVKSTTSKYIVATHTEVSYTTTNGVNYKVSKLTVVYNTGEKQVLETTKEKAD